MPSTKLTKFRPLGRPGTPWPKFVRDCRDQSGIYVIKDGDDGVVLYVGESHSNRLYDTLTRHFQAWTNRHQTAGKLYDRRYCLVAIKATGPDKAVAEQNRQIARLGPLDNDIQPEGVDDAPF